MSKKIIIILVVIAVLLLVILSTTSGFNALKESNYYTEEEVHNSFSYKILDSNDDLDLMQGELILGDGIRTDFYFTYNRNNSEDNRFPLISREVTLNLDTLDNTEIYLSQSIIKNTSTKIKLQITTQEVRKWYIVRGLPITRAYEPREFNITITPNEIEN